MNWILIDLIDDTWQLFGIVSSILSLFLTMCLTFYIQHIDGKQRKRDESFYKITTMKDIQQLKEHLINIQNISESERSIADIDEQIEISQRLVDYANKNEKFIEALIVDTRLSMSKWMNLEDNERRNIESFIENITWVLSNYLPKLDENKETQIIRWSTNFEEFQNRKNKSFKKIENLELKYV